MFWHITLLRCSFLNWRFFLLGLIVGIGLLERIWTCRSIHHGWQIGFCCSLWLAGTAFTFGMVMTTANLFFRSGFLLHHMQIQFLDAALLECIGQFIMNLL